MTASAYRDPIASMTTIPLRGVVPSGAVQTQFGRPPAFSVTAVRPVPPLAWPTQSRYQSPAVVVPGSGSDQLLQRLALGLLLTVLLLGIPLAVYLASLT